MKQKTYLFLLCSFLATSLQSQNSAVTILDHVDWGGRLGDKLIMYVKAKWVAHKRNLPFYFKPFPHSDLFALHNLEKRFSSAINKQYGSKRTLKDIFTPLEQCIQPNDNTLYIIHYYFHEPAWGSIQRQYDSQEIMTWPGVFSDTGFKEELRKMIKPRDQIAIVHPPKDRISVALHVRKGGGFDHPLFSRQIYDINNLDPIETTPTATYADKYWPLKFLPDQYYLDQLIRLSEMLHDQPLYVYLFTDDENPKALMERYKQYLNKDNITFDCRENRNHHSLNLLEDIFSIAQFDCLIRNGSNFPQISQLIGSHKIVIYPLSSKWVGNHLIADQIGTYIDPSFQIG